jgi:hypothetical protein
MIDDDDNDQDVYKLRKLFLLLECNEYKNEILCPESKELNGGLHLMIRSPMNSRRKICLLCAEIIDYNN